MGREEGKEKKGVWARRRRRGERVGKIEARKWARMAQGRSRGERASSGDRGTEKWARSVQRGRPEENGQVREERERERYGPSAIT